MFTRLRHNFRIARLARVLGAPLDPQHLLEQLTSKRPNPKDTALEELLDVCTAEPRLRRIIAEARATRDQLRDIYHALVLAGAGQWAGRHYVPVSALAFPDPLTLVLANAQAHHDWGYIGVLLIEYFERGDSGPVPTTLRGPSDANDPTMPLWEVQKALDSGRSEHSGIGAEPKSDGDTPTEAPIGDRAITADVMPVSALNPSPIRSGLPSPLLTRAMALHSSLAGLYDVPLEEWIEGFERDANPAREIGWWEWLVKCYEQFVQEAHIPIASRPAAFRMASRMALGVPASDLGEELGVLPPGALDVMRRCLKTG